ncbi:MAG: alpha-L-fucosidase [Gemmatimonadota bacterium]|jgi:alpha-L-fucosidase|nr:alpha-L-fucosidase [Gemmatimonadota bacterium]
MRPCWSVVLLLLATTLPLAAPAQEAAVPAERLAAREAYADWKVGLFIHWGVYSVLMDGEWVMQNRGIRAREYERIPPQFNPSAFDASAWVALARAAGLRYITMTAKHHDGFAMWDTKLTPWNVVDSTPYGKDVIRQLADASHADGMPLFLYYSQLDWHHPDFWPLGGTGHSAGRPEGGDWSRYLTFMDGQLRELLTGYGPVAGVWLDGLWDKGGDWQLPRTYAMMRQLQPDLLIASNHNGPPHPGEDIITFERDINPAHIPAGNTLPLEISEKINDTWGFRLHDVEYKTPAQLIRAMVRAAGRGANYLVNVGPMPDGRIQPEFVERLLAMGQWLRTYGESVYDTRPGPVPPRPWGVTTRKADTIYVHVLDWADRSLALPPLDRQVQSARRLGDGVAVAVRQGPEGVILTLPDGPRNPVDEVVALILGR